MAKFNYLESKTRKTSLEMDRAKYEELITSERVTTLCDQARQAHEGGNMDAYDQEKGRLPLALWLGYDAEHRRQAEVQMPTQYFYIDIDHATKSAREILWEIQKMILERDTARFNGQTMEQMLHESGIRLVHETPSGGFRMVCVARPGLESVEEQIAAVAEEFNLQQFGDVDGVVKDFARGSFIVKKDWHLFIDDALWTEEPEKVIKVSSSRFQVSGVSGGKEQASDGKLPEITQAMRDLTYNGVKVSKIAEEYVASKGGVPEQGQRHAFYNELVKNFRNLCDSDARYVFAVLPLCEGEPERRWSQCASICRSNNTTLIPKDFYFWLKAHGYVESKRDEAKKSLLEGETATPAPPPVLPPVFREFCEVCPQDFVYPTVVALMPVMGTLTSYVQAMYMDGTMQTTTFFCTIYAPPSSNKSFASRLVDTLMSKIAVRDELNSLREQLFMVEHNSLGDNKQKPALPHVKVRVMPAIFSVPEFLEKMRDNKGYHMFTFAEEVDTFAKGAKAGGGGDKSDMYRCAWDNAKYGQSYKSNQTFKGTVKLFYNILLTGTTGAVKRYYHNVEDGMVTRVSITGIENQEFAEFQGWKSLTKRQAEVIDRFVERCDRNSYEKPLANTIDDAYTYNVSPKEYDKNIEWRFNYNERQTVDMRWLFAPLKKWLEAQRIEASKSQDYAKDVFRKRAAVKAFRLGLLATQCWVNVTQRERKIITDFVVWFAGRDLEESLKFFGARYNQQVQESTQALVKDQPSLYDSLPRTFTKNDVVKKCMELNIITRVREIIYRWSRDGVIKKMAEKGVYEKSSLT